jgi:hypothetical protein
MDSTQMWFCRDLWTDAARDGLKEKGRKGHQNQRLNAGSNHKKRDLPVMEVGGDDAGFIKTHTPGQKAKRDKPVGQAQPQAQAAQEKPNEERQVEQPKKGDGRKTEDEQSSSDQDAIDEDDSTNPPPEPLKPQDLPASAFLIPNTAFTAARILVNPRCVTTYGGVSHTQLALDLFGGEKDEDPDAQHRGGKYVLDDWSGPPDSFVCQEMRTTGGRTAPKSQRRVGFLLQNEVGI